MLKQGKQQGSPFILLLPRHLPVVCLRKLASNFFGNSIFSLLCYPIRNTIHGQVEKGRGDKKRTIGRCIRQGKIKVNQDTEQFCQAEGTVSSNQTMRSTCQMQLVAMSPENKGCFAVLLFSQ